MPNLLKVQTVWEGIGGAPYYSTLHFGAGEDAAESQQAVDAVAAFWTTMQGVIRAGLTWAVNPEVLVFQDTDGALVRADVVEGFTGAGTSASEILPRASSGLVRWSTGIVVGRRFVRGRTFIPLPTEVQNDVLGVPTAGYKTTVQTAVDALLGSTLVVLHIWSRPKPATAPGGARPGEGVPVANGTVWDEWAVLRSRRD